MNILHYFLGLPPMRSGGLTKYALDLMLEEKKQGHQVYALFPGNFTMCSKESTFVKSSAYRGIETYKMTNALPVPLMYGVSNPVKFCERREILGFDKLLKDTKPNILHIHTFMGLPVELIRLFKFNDVKIVFTSHDYFGLCPKVNFVNREGMFCEMALPSNCKKCCENSLPLPFLWVRNLPFMGELKKYIK